MNNQKSTDVSIKNTLSGKYKVYVIDSDNNVVVDFPWQKNLILNQGMDAVPTHEYQRLMYYAAGGNGTRNNSVYSFNSSASVVGTSMTLVPGISSASIQSFTGSYGGYSSILQTGDMIKFDDSTEVRVVAVSNTSASITPSSNVPLQPFTVWKTSQVGLQSEHKRTGEFFAGVGYCQTTTVNTTSSIIRQLRRTWDFSYETSPYTYTEVGVGWSDSGNDTIFSRVVLPSPVYIDTAQKLRLIYELDIGIYPTASYPGTPFTASIIGWGTGSVVYGHQGVDNIITSTVDTSGAGGGIPISEPVFNGVGYCMYASNSSSSYVEGDKGGSAAEYANNITTDTYIPGSHTLYRTGNFTVSQLARNDIRTIGIGFNYYGAGWSPGHTAFFAVFTENQTKTNVQTLALSWVWRWGRVLS